MCLKLHLGTAPREADAFRRRLKVPELGAGLQVMQSFPKICWQHTTVESRQPRKFLECVELPDTAGKGACQRQCSAGPAVCRQRRTAGRCGGQWLSWAQQPQNNNF